MIFYKLTDQHGRTGLNTHPINVTQWGPGVTHSAMPGNGELCSKYYIHLYADPLIAVLMNSQHANFLNPLLWECHIDGNTKNDMGLKCGAKTVTTLRTIPLPVMTLTQRTAAVILLAAATLEMTGVVIPAWSLWADKWLSGEDRDAASDAAYAAIYSARAVRTASEAASDSDAASAACAANDATYAARAARAASDAARAASDAANAASYSAYATSYSASAASAASDAEFSALLITCLYAAMDIE